MADWVSTFNSTQQVIRVDDEWAIAGIAIEKVPEPSSVLALGLMGGGMILRTLKKRQ